MNVEDNWRQRLREACRLYSVKSISSYLGVSQSVISQVVNGSYRFPAEKLKYIVERKVVSVDEIELAYKRPKKTPKLLLQAQIVDLIFVGVRRSEEMMVLLNASSAKVSRGLTELEKKGLIAIYYDSEMKLGNKGKPCKLYRLSCNCFAPGLMPECGGCHLGQFLIDVDKRFGGVDDASE